MTMTTNIIIIREIKTVVCSCDGSLMFKWRKSWLETQVLGLNAGQSLVLSHQWTLGFSQLR